MTTDGRQKGPDYLLGIIPFIAGLGFIAVLLAYVYFPRPSDTASLTPTLMPTITPIDETATPLPTIATPTVLPQKIVLDVPKYAQTHAASCEVASTHAAMLYFGVNVTENTLLKEIGADLSPRYFDKQGNLHWGNPQKKFVGNVDAKQVYVDGYGVYNQPIAKELVRHGFSRSISHTNWNLGDLFTYVRQGFPAIVWISNDFSTQKVGTMIAADGTKNPWIYREHAVVLRGVDVAAGSVYIMDVGSGKYKTVSTELFQQGFANLHNMAIVVIPNK